VISGCASGTGSDFRKAAETGAEAAVHHGTVVKAVLLVTLLSGCDKIFTLGEVTSHDADIDAAVFSCEAPVLLDDFTSAAPCAPWGALGSAGTVMVTEADGALTFELSNMGEAKCATTTPIGAPYGGLAVRAAQTPAGTTSYMSLTTAALDLEIYMQAGKLNFAHAGGVGVIASVQYNALDMQYWRIEPDRALMTAAASYSANGVTWTAFSGTATLATLPATVDVQIKAGAFGVGSPTHAEFQHLVGCP
jgi:hypothetical protein